MTEQLSPFGSFEEARECVLECARSALRGRLGQCMDEGAALQTALWEIVDA